MNKKNSLSETIYDELKQKILLNQLRPGDALSESNLVSQYYISRTPVRQALKKLEDRGLVVIKDGVGTFVTFVSLDAVQDAYEVRNALEKIAIRTSIHKITERELSDLEAEFLALKKRFSQGGYGASLDRVVTSDWALHDLIVKKSENTFLPVITERIDLVLRRYQYANVSSFERAIDEHLEIIHYIKERNLEKVLQVLDSHIQFKPI